MAKQKRIPGTELDIPDGLEEAVDELQGARSLKGQAAEQEKLAAARVAIILSKAGLSRIRLPSGYVVSTVASKPKVVCEPCPPEETDDEHDEVPIADAGGRYHDGPRPTRRRRQALEVEP